MRGRSFFLYFYVFFIVVVVFVLPNYNMPVTRPGSLAIYDQLFAADDNERRL